MSEQLSQGLTPEEDAYARDLYGNKHRRYAESLGAALDVMRRAEDARNIVKEARGNGTIDDVPYETRVFANGESVQRQALDHVQLFYDANLWRAYRHKQDHLEAYMAEAAEAGAHFRPQAS